jgi:hypothetical protein
MMHGTPHARRQKNRPSDRNDQIVFSQKFSIYDNRPSLHSKIIDLDTASGFEFRQGIDQFRRNVIEDNRHPQTPVGLKGPGRRHHCLIVKPISKNGRIDVSTEGRLIDPIDHFLGQREPQRKGASIERWRLQWRDHAQHNVHPYDIGNNRAKKVRTRKMTRLNNVRRKASDGGLVVRAEYRNAIGLDQFSELPLKKCKYRNFMTTCLNGVSQFRGE